MKKILLQLTVVSSLALASCDKGGDPVKPAPYTGKMASRLVASENDFQAFSYNNDRQLTHYTTQWQTSPDGGVTRVDFQYQFEGGRLKQMTCQSGKATYFYEGDKPAKADFFRTDGRKLATHIFLYDNQSRISEAIELIEQPQDIYATRFKYSYRPDGNVGRTDYQTRASATAPYVTIFSKVYESYDDKPNTLSASVMDHFLPGVRLFRNNPLTIKELGANGATTGIIRMSYEYDNQGLPVKRQQQFETGGVVRPAINFNYQY